MSPLRARDPNESEDDEDASQAGEDLPVLTEIDHVGIAVHDLPGALDTYREAFGAVVEHREELVDEEPRPGSRGTLVAFLHPRAVLGTLICLVEE